MKSHYIAEFTALFLCKCAAKFVKAYCLAHDVCIKTNDLWEEIEWTCGKWQDREDTRIWRRQLDWGEDE